MRTRLLSLFLAFVLVFSTFTIRPQKVYAFAGTATVATLALTFISACGITFLASEASTISDTVDEFLSKNPDQEEFLGLLVNNHTDPLTGSVVLSTSLFLTYKDQIISLLQSIYNFFTADDTGSGSIITGDNPFLNFSSYDFSVDALFNIPYIGKSSDSQSFGSSLYGVNFSPFFVRIDSSSSDNDIYFYYLLKNSDNTYSLAYTFYRYTRVSSGFTNYDTVLDYSTNYVYDDTFNIDSFVPYISNSDLYSTKFKFFLSSSYFKTFDCLDNILFLNGLSSPIFAYASSNNMNSNNYLSYTLTNYYDDMIAGLPVSDMYITDFTSSDYIYSFPEDVTADDVITGWTDALEQENKDVILNPVLPDELLGVNGYDVAYGTEGVSGAVEGVDLPQGALNPDVPVTPDLSGITGLLNKILNFIKSIPALIIGTTAVDFSGFNNISVFDKFPFCIPFDLVNAIQQLNAPPVAPVFKVDFKDTIMEPAGSIEIDLAKFENIAKIFRFFEFFGFVAGLIVLTRNIIRG